MSENFMPAEVTLCEVTFGPPVSYIGRGGIVNVKLSATHTIVHEATGVQLRSGDDILATVTEGENLVFSVPHVDQAGFIDSAGNPFTHWAYTLTGSITFGAKVIPVLRSFQVFEGQDSVDLDLVPDGAVLPGVTAPSAAVLSVAGQTGTVTAEELAEALDLGGASALEVGTTAGTVAAGDDTRITGAAQKASNLSDLASAATARINLGLGDAATKSTGTAAGTVAAGDDTRITGAAQKASNLSDLPSAATARTNLGLGTAAVENAGVAGGVAELDGTGVVPDAQLPSRLSESGLSASFAALDGTRRVWREPGDGLAGAFDAAFDMTAGYGLHLTASSDDAATGYRAVVGIGTDEGDASGIFVSQKRDGRGIDVVQQPGATAEGIAIDGRAQSTAALQAAIHPGNSGFMLILTTGKGYRGGVITAGSSNLYLANGDFTAGDVGRAVTQAASAGVTGDLPGTLAPGTTIASVTDANNIVLSAPAVHSASRLQVLVADRAPADSQPILRLYDDSNAFVFRATRRTVEAFQPFSAAKGAAITGPGTFTSDANSDVPVTITGKASGTQTGSLLKVTRSGDISVSLEVTAAALVVHRMGTIMHNAGSTATTPVKVTNSATTGVPTLHVNTAASPAAGADALRIMESTDTTILSRFDRNGYFMTRKTAAPADGDIGAGEMALWFDSTNGAAKLMVKAKQADGTVRTGSVALA